MNRIDSSCSRTIHAPLRVYLACGLVLVLTLLCVMLTACTPSREIERMSKLPFPQSNLQEMLGIVDDLFDPDGTVHHYASELTEEGHEQLVPVPLREAHVGMYIWFGQSRYFVKVGSDTVKVPNDGHLIAQLNHLPSPHELRGLAGVDGVELTDTHDLDKILQVLEKVGLNTLILKDVRMGLAGVEALNKMQNLREVYFYGVRSVSLAKFTSSGIAKLHVKAVEPESVLPSILNGCRQVRDLSLQDGALTEETVSAITNMIDLTHLFLNHSNLNDRWLARIVPNPRWHLCQLEMHQTGITDLGLNSACKQLSLENLNLSRCAVTDSGLRSVVQLTNLQVLDLANTNTSDQTVSLLPKLKKLWRLNISNTKISPACFVYLSKMKTLRVLTLGRQGFSFDLLLKLKKELPDCDIQVN